MKRSKEATRKYIEQARAYLDEYMSMTEEEFSSVHVSVSLGNAKIGKCLNVSLLPFFTCVNCSECIGTCYAISSALRFPNVCRVWAKNTAIAKRDHNRFFTEIEEAIEKHPSYDSFRWHVAGDIRTKTYLFDMMAIAYNHPNMHFWSYSKNHLVFEYRLPENFHIQKSTGFGVSFNPAISGQFHCVRAGQEPPKGVMRCGGDCSYCVKHGIGCPVGQNVWTWEH